MVTTQIDRREALGGIAALFGTALIAPLRRAVAAGAFFETVKQLTVTGYYTSEIGMTVERVYLPIPGRYDGAYSYAEVGRLFSA